MERPLDPAQLAMFACVEAAHADVMARVRKLPEDKRREATRALAARLFGELQESRTTLHDAEEWRP